MTRTGPPAAGPIGPFGVATIAVSLAFMAAGIVLPQAAGAFLRLFLAVLAVGFILTRAYGAMLPARMTQGFYSPFDRAHADRPIQTIPEPLRKFAAELAAADDGRLAGRTPIPWSVRWRVIDEAARRLADHHGLNLDDAGHHAAIRALVTEPTWRLIARPAPDPPGATGASQPAASPPVSRLPLILDDLERL